MKQALALALLFFAVASATSRAAEVEAVSRIGSVTVFPMGAEVVRVSKVELGEGEHTIVFRDLPAGAVEGSIRVEGSATGRLEIGSVDTRRLFVPRADADASASERRRIEREIERLKDQRSNYEAEVEGAETQKALIANLAQLPTRPAPSSGLASQDDWTAVLALIPQASADAQRAQLAAQVKIRDVDRRIEDLEKTLREVAPERTERTEARVFVVAHGALEADITVRYQVAHASWTPLYDVRLTTGAKTVAPQIALTRRAAINQRSGEAWDDVEVILSTTRPTAGASAPELDPMIVDFERPPALPAPSVRQRFQQGERMAAPQDGGAGQIAEDMVAAAPVPEPVVIEEQSAATVQAPFHALFAVPGRLSIPETGETKRVQLGSETLEPALTLRTVPKLDAKAYLYAKFNTPRGAPLLPGAASLFRDGTFVGSGKLPLLSPGEEHEIGFGVDDLVRVRHAIAEQKRGESGLISTSRTDSRHYQISVKSMHERPISLAVFDQVPVSADQAIKVELVGRSTPTRRDVDDKRGVLVWESELGPDEEQTIEFGYRVSWPSDKSVIYRQ